MFQADEQHFGQPAVGSTPSFQLIILLHHRIATASDDASPFIGLMVNEPYDLFRQEESSLLITALVA